MSLNELLSFMYSTPPEMPDRKVWSDWTDINISRGMLNRDIFHVEVEPMRLSIKIKTKFECKLTKSQVKLFLRFCNDTWPGRFRWQYHDKYNETSMWFKSAPEVYYRIDYREIPEYGME